MAWSRGSRGVADAMIEAKISIEIWSMGLPSAFRICKSQSWFFSPLDPTVHTLGLFTHMWVRSLGKVYKSAGGFIAVGADDLCESSRDVI